MSLKSKFISVLTVGAGVVVFSTAGFAQDDKAASTTTAAPEKTERPFGDRHKGDHKFGGRHGKRGGERGMFRGLNLTEEQKTQMKSIRESNRPDPAAFAQLKAIHESRKAGTPLTPEQEATMKWFRQQGRAKAKAEREQMLAVLTPEQKATLDTRKAEMKQHMQERRQQWEQRKQNGTTAPAATDKPKDN